MKKIVTVLLALCIGLFVFSGCNNLFDDGTKKVDPTKTQIYVGVYEGGVGTLWLDDIIERFEADYTDYQVFVDPEKTMYEEQYLSANWKNMRQDIFIVNDLNYALYKNEGIFEPITDIVTDPLTEFGETRSIADKLEDGVADFYDDDGVYYSLPHIKSSYQIVYDVDLFNEECLYFGQDGEFISDLSQTKSYGQDGEPNTYDDGLPETYSQFFKLLQEIDDRGMTPFTWSGEYDFYFANMLTSMWADYEGYDDMSLNYTFDGPYTFPEGTLSDEEVEEWGAVTNDDGTQTVTITNENAFLLQKQAGKLYTLEFAHDIIANSENYSGDAFSPIQTHDKTQEEYIFSASPKWSGERIAMIVEGTWWQNEAEDIFDSLADASGSNGDQYRSENRKFGIMPFPKAEDGSSDEEGAVYIYTGNTQIFINSASDHKDIAKLFLRYMHTDENLKAMTEMTGIFRPFEYEIDEDNLPYYFSKMVNQYYESKPAVYNLNINKMRRDSMSSDFAYTGWNWTCTSNTFGGVQTAPHKAFHNYPKGTAQSYFAGLSATFNAKDWKEKYAEWF